MFFFDNVLFDALSKKKLVLFLTFLLVGAAAIFDPHFSKEINPPCQNNFCLRHFHFYIAFGIIFGFCCEICIHYFRSFKQSSSQTSYDSMNFTHNNSATKETSHDKKDTFNPFTQVFSDKELECLRILECNAGASWKSIQKKYRSLAHKFHPDKFANTRKTEDEIKLMAEQFRKIQEAYDYLKETKYFEK